MMFSQATAFRILAVVRICTGGLLVYHGLEIFSTETMEMYMDWEQFRGRGRYILVYAGKASELISGILLLVGLYTRIASILMIGTFFYITFFVGGGRFWYEDQHPFLFVLLGFIFFFTGSETWSIDAKRSRK
ncbi:DoxX family protein [Fulvivirga sedimenti]|uniref:DoxX family protein n=1 Tax=Fulvivirga sedimenti TaxID=2879465 RepID=A0A9X1HYS6_9BACT|nr:DoxX family membrane protein [Fulvivirga sedimenti]MCA6078914.1 DoxX family protein [Fulvivirga sedimenti]